MHTLFQRAYIAYAFERIFAGCKAIRGTVQLSLEQPYNNRRIDRTSNSKKSIVAALNLNVVTAVGISVCNTVTFHYAYGPFTGVPGHSSDEPASNDTAKPMFFRVGANFAS